MGNIWEIALKSQFGWEASLGREIPNTDKWSRSHGRDSHLAHIW